GKRKGAPLASGATPVSGVALKGPTASLISTTKLPVEQLANGIANNHKLSRSLLSRHGNLDIFRALIEGYFKGGGMQVQFIIRDKETLIDAQNHPEEYRDLLVRVSGYSAYFCDLNRQMQDEIIARTEDNI
ncbi:formate C-acetyltransferase/glycerol dehydratase family glycyl radical enzyme, partial [Candidatus Desantisbacteria bacterium CG07_land_8_20_14_0_80_39_15]